jgi:TolB protein
MSRYFDGLEMKIIMNRRRFVALGLAATFIDFFSGCRGAAMSREARKQNSRLFFTTQGRTALINADGTGLRYFDFKAPDQVTWQPGPFLADGRRVLFLSMAV